MHFHKREVVVGGIVDCNILVVSQPHYSNLKYLFLVDCIMCPYDSSVDNDRLYYIKIKYAPCREMSIKKKLLRSFSSRAILAF